jgi:predicted ATPase
MVLSTKPYLREITLQRDQVESFETYPLNLPAISSLTNLTFHPDVTFFIGENGSGKSTLLEALAVSLEFNPEGGNRNTAFTSRATHSSLNTYLKLIRNHKRPRDYYFLRAESFYNLASHMDDVNYLKGYGGQSLHEQSHGEAFLAVLEHKLRGQGLYLLDEPEAALSPARQLQAIGHLHRLVQQQSQFIIVTHSPILLAYPNAMIYQFHDSGINPIAYTETEHYTLTKMFLNRHESMLHQLLE